MELATIKRKVAKDAKANGHSLKWGKVYGNAQSNLYSQNAVCKHCLAGVACHEGEHVITVTYTRFEGKTTMSRKCKDVVAEIGK